jgi:hypothetical protein
VYCMPYSSKNTVKHRFDRNLVTAVGNRCGPFDLRRQPQKSSDTSIWSFQIALLARRQSVCVLALNFLANSLFYRCRCVTSARSQGPWKAPVEVHNNSPDR